MRTILEQTPLSLLQGRWSTTRGCGGLEDCSGVSRAWGCARAEAAGAQTEKLHSSPPSWQRFGPDATKSCHLNPSRERVANWVELVGTSVMWATWHCKCLCKLQLDAALVSRENYAWNFPVSGTSLFMSFQCAGHTAGNEDVRFQQGTYLYYQITPLFSKKVQSHVAYSPSWKELNHMCQLDLV